MVATFVGKYPSKLLPKIFFNFNLKRHSQCIGSRLFLQCCYEQYNVLSMTLRCQSRQDLRRMILFVSDGIDDGAGRIVVIVLLVIKVMMMLVVMLRDVQLHSGCNQGSECA